MSHDLVRDFSIINSLPAIHRHANHIPFLLILAAMILTACHGRRSAELDELGERAYYYHYRNLDSTACYARKALQLAREQGLDPAEAINHLAFVSIAKMQYGKAKQQLDSLYDLTNNEIEMLIADVQQMRLCQRQSSNRDFYFYRELAIRRLHRIDDENESLSPHEQARLIYARSEMSIVVSSYYYYVGLIPQSLAALQEIVPNGEVLRDTAQLINYWYNIGAGGILTEGTADEIAKTEMDYLIRTCQVAQRTGQPFWEAQSLQAMSEHVQQADNRQWLKTHNSTAYEFINRDHMPDTLLAGYLAQRARDLFADYGDVYQTAGADRTLAECFWQIEDYQSALACLQRALTADTLINQAPDLVASIREQMSLVYSAVDDKPSSDRSRNIYLDLQEQTRQDRELEARAQLLEFTSKQLNLFLVAVILAIILVVVLLYLFDRMRRRSDARFSLDTLLEPLKQWQKEGTSKTQEAEQRYEELQDKTRMTQLHLEQHQRRNLEQRAKVKLVTDIMPLIDRMANEVQRLQRGGEAEEVMRQHYQYIAELTDTINLYNDRLTEWIQMRQGEVSLKVESFALQDLFQLVQRSRMSYQIKGITLIVEPTEAVVKADRTLTLFMLNTIADNARKATSSGGTITVSAQEAAGYVEISVSDTGEGMSAETLDHIFDRTYAGGHGFGLKNCRGIIEKYKKLSRIFSVCSIGAESEVGKGSRLFFRLPKGTGKAVGSGWMKLLLPLLMCASTASAWAALEPADTLETDYTTVSEAQRWADSAYFANVNGRYEETLRFADSCQHYLAPTDTMVLLDVSNETAVAALALHRWELYHKSNSIYTRLFREISADATLPSYVEKMQRSQTDKTVAIVLLVVLLALLFPAYFYLYLRYRLNYRYCIDRINAMNRVLLSDLSDSEKLQEVKALAQFNKIGLSAAQKQGLDNVVAQIEQALQASIDLDASQHNSIELAEDDLRRLQLDLYQLHVSNSVLDNCLSTLKHETMYYPARIRQLVDADEPSLPALAEVVDYYKELYHLLSLQAVDQVPPLRLTGELHQYLMELLQKLNGGEQPQLTDAQTASRCTRLHATLHRYSADADICRYLFTPQTADLRFLICRQIVREMGEATNLRACGITATTNESGQLQLEIIVPEKAVQGGNEIEK